MAKLIRKKQERVAVDPVTHKPHATILDEPQIASERCVQAIDGALCRMPTSSTAPGYALVEEAKALLAYLESDQPVPEVVEPLATIAREYRKLDPLHQPRLTAKLWERFRAMLPHQG